MCMMIVRTLRRVYARAPVMAVFPWRTTKMSERDAPCTQFGTTRGNRGCRKLGLDSGGPPSETAEDSVLVGDGHELVPVHVRDVEVVLHAPQLGWDAPEGPIEEG